MSAAASRRIFVLLVGEVETEAADHFQLLQERTAREEGRRLGLDVEVVQAPAFDQLRVLKRRLLDAEKGALDAVVTEPASTSALDIILKELRGKTGLILLSAGEDSIRQAAPGWGTGLPIGAVGTNHVQVGEMQGRQARDFLSEQGRVLYVAGPPRSVAAQQRLEGLRSQLG